METDTNKHTGVISPEIKTALKELLPLVKSQAELARQLGVSSTQLSRALGDGDFKYNVPEFEERVRSYIASLAKARPADDHLITTGFLVESMDNFLSTTHATKDIGVCWSDAGFGKTKGLMVYAQRNPLCVVVSARKALCGWRAVRDAILAQLAQKRRIGGESWDAFLLRTFSGSGRLLAIDNAHLLTESARQWLAYDWHEVTGCPLALIGNPAIKDQWSRNDQHQSRVGLAYAVSPQSSAAETARTMLRLYLPEGEHDAATVKLATAVVKSKGACRSLKKHSLLAAELRKQGAQPTPAAAFKAAHSLLLSAPDLNLEAA